MYGNPYNFETYYSQEKVFDITDLGIITGIKVEFYQKANSFIDKNSELIPYVTNDEILLLDNLFVNNIYIGLGYDLNSFDSDLVNLYTFDTTTYIKTKDETENEKTIHLRWIHIDDNDNPIDVYKDDSSMGEYEIRWYKYKLGAPSADEYSGVYWEKVNLKKTVEEYIEFAEINST
jgi:hypothetical protein